MPSTTHYRGANLVYLEYRKTKLLEALNTTGTLRIRGQAALEYWSKAIASLEAEGKIRVTRSYGICEDSGVLIWRNL